MKTQTGAVSIALALAMCAGASGQSSNQVMSVTPSSGPQGTNGMALIFTLDTDVPPPPPTNVLPATVTLGGLAGTSFSRPAANTVGAVFSIPQGEPAGAKDATVTFSTPNGTLTFSKAAAFTVTVSAGVSADFTAAPTYGVPPLVVAFSNRSAGTVTGHLWSFGDGATATNVHPSHTYTTAGVYTVSLTVSAAAATSTLTRASYITATTLSGAYVVVDTAQTRCYGATAQIAAPAAGQAFYGQDAQCTGVTPSYALSGDGLTVFDNRTGLAWQRSPETSGDGTITAADKLTWTQAQARPATLNAAGYGGYSDWRLPTIKELYSLIDFRGTDPSGLEGSDTSGLTPFIDTNYFRFAYGDTVAGERIIDSQYASCTLYVSTVDEALLFGVNFADGRIKGYGLTLMGSDKTFFVQCVRGNTAYGMNLLVDNGDQTVTDRATGLMWTKADSGAGMNWSNALAWAQQRNAAGYLGHRDWRLPNAKELQSIVDYSRSPDTSASPAIDPVFSCTRITDEEYQADYPWYWSGTTHATYNGSGNSAAYVCFGRALGYMNGTWRDIHGAGCQRSDPKASLTGYTALDNGYYNAIAPQGDAVRMLNFVRLVRDYPADADSVGDGIPDWWRAHHFGGNGMTTNAVSCATCDADGDGAANLAEYAADTQPTNRESLFRITSVAYAGDTAVAFRSSSNRTYTLDFAAELGSGEWTNVVGQAAIPGSGGVDVLRDPAGLVSQRVYRVEVNRP